MVSLGEILQAKGDADYANGGEGGVISPDLYSSAAANEYLQHAADLTYNAHRYLAEQHDRNMQNELQGLNNVDFKDLLPQDQASLMPEYGGVAQQIAQNFGAIRNPLGNPDAWANLKNSESSIRQKLAQAQSDAAFINKQNEFVQLHPEYNTPDFQQKKAAFLAAPVGQRQPFVVTPPLTYNPATAYKTIAELAKKKYANSGTNGKYITQEEGEKIDPDQYAKLALSLPGTDQYGNSIEAARQAAYDKLPANLKPATYQDYVKQEAQLYKPQDQVSKSSIEGDPYGTINANFKKQFALQKDRENFEAAQSAKDDDIRLQIAGLKTKEGAIDPNATGAYVNKVYHDMVTGDVAHGSDYRYNLQNPNVSNGILQTIYGDNTPVKLTTKSVNANKDAGTSQTAEGVNTVPTISIIGNKMMPDGRVFIMRHNNLTNKAENPIYVSQGQFYNDLSGILGAKNAPKVQEAAREWLQKNTGDTQPDVSKLHAVFAPGTAAPVAPTGGLSNDAYNEFLKKNGLSN